MKLRIILALNFQIQAKEYGLAFDPNIRLTQNLSQKWALYTARVQFEDIFGLIRRTQQSYPTFKKIKLRLILALKFQIQAEECGLPFDPNIRLRRNLGQKWALHIHRIQFDDLCGLNRLTWQSYEWSILAAGGAFLAFVDQFFVCGRRDAKFYRTADQSYRPYGRIFLSKKATKKGTARQISNKTTAKILLSTVTV